MSKSVIHPVLVRIPHLGHVAGPQIISRQRDFSRIALLHSARLIGAPQGDWPTTAERVPIARDGFYWSIAHKPRFAAAVVAPQPVGIDIESVTPRGRDLSPAVASEEEWSKLQSPFGRDGTKGQKTQKNEAEVDWLSFFQMWTAKEATLKANGKGIGGLKACRLEEITQTKHFMLQFEGRQFPVEHLLYAAHVAACTCDGSRLQWHVIEAPAVR